MTAIIAPSLLALHTLNFHHVLGWIAVAAPLTILALWLRP